KTAGREHRTLIGPATSYRLDFSPRGDLLATADTDGLRLWDVGTGQVLQQIRTDDVPVNAVRFSPDGLTLAAAGLNLRVYRLHGLREPRQLTGHAERVHTLAAHPRRPWLASAAYEADVLLHDLESGRLLRHLPGVRAKGPATGADREVLVDGLAFSADGAALA